MNDVISSPEIRAACAVEHAFMARANGSALRTILRVKQLKGDIEYRRTILALRSAIAVRKAQRAEIRSRAYDAGWESARTQSYYGHTNVMSTARNAAEFIAAVTLDAQGDRRVYVDSFMAGARDYGRACMRSS